MNFSGIFPGRLVPDASVAGCIDIYENVWPDPETTILTIETECQKIDSGFTWSKASTIGHGLDQNSRTNYDLGISHIGYYNGNEVAQNIHNQFYILLSAAIQPYIEKHNIDNLYHEGYNMLKYNGGQEYKAHCDGGTDSGRLVSAICYLNNDFVGGEIEFINFGIKIKPEPGMLLLFPSNYAYSHIAHPVTSGTKYAIVTWLHDRPL